jgi:hypothetical protein
MTPRVHLRTHLLRHFSLDVDGVFTGTTTLLVFQETFLLIAFLVRVAYKTPPRFKIM